MGIITGFDKLLVRSNLDLPAGSIGTEPRSAYGLGSTGAAASRQNGTVAGLIATRRMLESVGCGGTFLDIRVGYDGTERSNNYAPVGAYASFYQHFNAHL
jgi:hypothetical protein